MIASLSTSCLKRSSSKCLFSHSIQPVSITTPLVGSGRRGYAANFLSFPRHKAMGPRENARNQEVIQKVKEYREKKAKGELGKKGVSITASVDYCPSIFRLFKTYVTNLQSSQLMEELVHSKAMDDMEKREKLKQEYLLSIEKFAGEITVTDARPPNPANIFESSLLGIPNPFEKFNMEQPISMLEREIAKSESEDKLCARDIIRPTEEIRTKTEIFLSSVKKLTLEARPLRKMPVLKALDILHFSKRKVSKPLGVALLQATHIARSKGWELKDTIIYTIEVQRKNIVREIKAHARGRFGVVEHRFVRALIIVRKYKPAGKRVRGGKKSEVNARGILAPIDY